MKHGRNKYLSGLKIPGELNLLMDWELHDGYLNMAIDEVILRNCSNPVLRVYGWEYPCVTFGYFGSREVVGEQVSPGTPLIRRWTGGGIVVHGSDWTYSLIVPSGNPFFGMRPAESYGWIHTRLCEALLEGGISCELEGRTEAQAGAGKGCFQNPVTADILHNGQKIAGAGQRRTREGLLHQGSVQGIDVPETVGTCLAGLLGERVVEMELSQAWVEEAQSLAVQRYQAEDWLNKS